MTLCETTVQHFLLLAPLYSHRKGLSVCHNHTSVCLKTSTAPLETLRSDSCKQPAFCWVQFLQNGKSEARSPTPWAQFNTEGRWTVSFPWSGTFAEMERVSVLLSTRQDLIDFIFGIEIMFHGFSSYTVAFYCDWLEFMLLSNPKHLAHFEILHLFWQPPKQYEMFLHHILQYWFDAKIVKISWGVL